MIKTYFNQVFLTFLIIPISIPSSMDFVVTPYRIFTGIFIKVYCTHRQSLLPKQNGEICMFILDLIKHNEYPFRQLYELISFNCEWPQITIDYVDLITETLKDINNLFELVKQMRDCSLVESHSVAGLYLRKIAIYFDRLTHQASSRLFDDLSSYLSAGQNPVKRRGNSMSLQTPRTTRSSGIHVDTAKNVKSIHHINHEIARLQANEMRALNPKDLYESLRRPNNSCKNDTSFLRYLNLLRVNEYVGSKHLLMAYFDMVSDSVSRSYSSLNHAIWYLHHGEYKRSIECLQECYCCAQAADDDKCLLISLMWLSRIVIQAKQKNSSKYNVIALLELVKKRSHKATMPYVQAMASMTLDQLNGPKDDSKILKKSSATLKQVALNSRQPNHMMMNANQPSPLDKDDDLPSAEILAVRNSMNDVLAMYYALLSAHLNLVDSNQSSALASQTLLHLDLIEKCGSEDVFLVNENIFIAIRNLAFHIWNSTRDIQLSREILVDLCSNNIPLHRTDYHSIWRQALSEISFEYHMEQENWSEASKMIDFIREIDQDGAQLRQSELLKSMGVYEEALYQVDELIARIEYEECSITDPTASDHEEDNQYLRSTSPHSMEHRAFIKSKALLLQATLLNDETKVLESLNYATENRFIHIRTACLMELAKRWLTKTDKIMESIVIEVFANGTKTEKRELRSMLASSKAA